MIGRWGYYAVRRRVIPAYMGLRSSSRDPPRAMSKDSRERSGSDPGHHCASSALRCPRGNVQTMLMMEEMEKRVRAQVWP